MKYPRILVVAATGLCAALWTYACGDGTTDPPPPDLPRAVANPDRAALAALYNATDGPNWIDNTNWLTDAPLADWYGVDTDASGRVQSLDLGENLLTGEIPPEFGKLTNLEELNLSVGNLSGEIPIEIGSLVKLRSLYINSNGLTGELPAEIGNLVNLETLQMWNNGLTGEIPPELGNLANMEYLWLSDNQLRGAIPSGMGNLASLRVLDIDNNQLTSSIPSSFLQLELDALRIRGNKSLCIPGTSDFLSWLREIEDRDDDSRSLFCNAADAAVLGQLYELAGGTGWTRSDGWAGYGALEERHGVTADSLGRVTELDLAGNGLTGRLTPKLRELDRMTVLRIGDNALSGRLPLGLTGLPLVEFHYRGTQLCAPADVSFRRWVNGISSYEGTGEECAPLSDREVLEVLHEATDGPNWSNNDGWLTDAPLAEWHGVSVDHVGRVVDLYLFSNQLTGEIPPELGDLANLTRLHLERNDLTGPIPSELGNLANLTELLLLSNQLDGEIPPELGNLANLTELLLSYNQLAGEIPPELGNLANLTWLWLDENQLAGEIPPELGNLANLTGLWLDENQLAGEIPPELGNLANLTELLLSYNQLTGEIPPELGNLANLTWLWLDENQLAGEIPPELGNLANLTWLRLAANSLTGPIPSEVGGMTRLMEAHFSHNSALAGPLPAEMTSLRGLEVLLASGTGLCVPMEGGFREWLAGVHKRRIPMCGAASPSAAYLTQAVQSWEFPVPLVAGRDALLRVFPTASRTTSEGIPAVRARFYVDGQETHVEDIPGGTVPIPIQVDEGDLLKSANAEIAGHVIQPGLEMVIEVDPGGTLDAALGVAKRIPATGRMAVEVESMPVFDLTLIPFVWTRTQDSSIVGLVDAMAADPENHEMLGDTRELLPIGELSVTAHEPVLSSSNNAFTLLDETEAIRILEGGTGHYKGMMWPPVTEASGVAYPSGRSSFSLPGPSTLAHELGHNFNLSHAPCGGAGGPDPSYPHDGGTIGAWVYDFDEAILVPPDRPDVMSYCEPAWISDYHFTNALRYRLFDEGTPDATASAAPNRSLLLWGGASADGVPFLEPSFVVDAIASQPDSAGDYTVTGRDASGRELFSLSFAMPRIADGDGSSSFVFALPVRPGWEALAEITLTGPDGSATLDGDSDRTMAILRNPRTGTVRGFLRDVLPPTRAALDAAGQVAGQGLEVLFSRGIPSTEAWLR